MPSQARRKDAKKKPNTSNPAVVTGPKVENDAKKSPTSKKASSKEKQQENEEVFNPSKIQTLTDIEKYIKTPYHVQLLLDSLSYNTEDVVRSPADALKVRKAHCFDGALLAAACFQRALKLDPLIVYLHAEEDDGHVIVLFSTKGSGSTCIGAVGKSNFVGLRYREPVYKNLRELVMSYFEVYFNTDGKRTLRSYSTPLNIKSLFQKLVQKEAQRIKKMKSKIPQTKNNKNQKGKILSITSVNQWEWDGSLIGTIEKHLFNCFDHDLLTTRQIKSLLPVDPRSLQAGTVGTDMAGVYKPGEKH